MKTLGSFLLGAAYVLGGILLFQIAWNFSVAPLFSLPQASYPQAIGLMVILWFLKRGISSNSPAN